MEIIENESYREVCERLKEMQKDNEELNSKYKKTFNILNEKINSESKMFERINKEYITKKVGASEMYKMLHLRRALLSGAIGSLLLCTVLPGTWVKAGAVGVCASVMGFFLYKTQLRMNYLVQEYELEVKNKVELPKE